ncbi:MAG: hypothetical protein Q7V53_07250 [Caldisericota bacterium]|nr:hypothetical protein [Caldisericota bacterium]
MRAFDFEIKSVDTANGVMNVEYIAEGHTPVEVGVRLPMEGEDEDALIELAAPHGTWGLREYLAAPKQLPVVGRKGRFEMPEPVAFPVAEVLQAPEIVVRKRVVV